jgi:spore coat polysaccharide biosynthesis protein SpsF (cytidylyltransferase family)/2-polyprenyl-3-methyl-5-hydroxy-6-metoxy-1,4-benzoquinol methylase
MTIIIVQCRLSSTRLPGKALMDLGGKPVLAWTLDAMKQVKADKYFVATDEASYNALLPVAGKCGWDCFIGPLGDVLRRFCLLIEQTDADTVIRATADNPFLFYEAAQALLDEYHRHRELSKCDYVTWNGLPHGSGVEIFNGKALLEAEKMTDDPYDHEHVGPALYNHRNHFTPFMLKAPARFLYPEFRTTIDTPDDYHRALAVVRFLSGGKSPDMPYTTEQILSAIQSPSIAHPVLYVPSVKVKQGTGHLRRCLDAARETGASIYIPDDAGLVEIPQLVEQARKDGLFPWQIVHDFPQSGEYALIAADCFSLDAETAQKLHAYAPLAAIDEGSLNTRYCDYLLDVIPSALNRPANMICPEFIEKPVHCRSGSQIAAVSGIKKVLVCLGGEDPAGLVVPAAHAFSGSGRCITAVIPQAEKAEYSDPVDKNITYCAPVPLLREKLADYDLVVTHYGLTAYEAHYAGCAVVLLATTPLHRQLSQKYGFVCIEKEDLTYEKVEKVLSNLNALYPSAVVCSEQKHIGPFIMELARGKRLGCPVCGGNHAVEDEIVARSEQRTFRRCAVCGIIYMAWTAEGTEKQYGNSYFAVQYKNQYGKTYLEDFDSIKAQGIRRIHEMDCILRGKKSIVSKPTVLDIGCAYGPFLSAAYEKGWQVFGTDISEEAVSYVQQSLLFPAACASFPDFDSAAEFGVQKFDAVTMWYVIEHFQDLNGVLSMVSLLVKDGGLFAFSTPCGEGVSAEYRKESFFAHSPSDHYTVWEPSRTERILKQFGFTVVKTVSTGHHPERFPAVQKNGWGNGSLPFKMYACMSRIKKLGDTFEVYCRKSGSNGHEK